VGGNLRDVVDAWAGLVARDRFGFPPSWVAESVRRTASVLVDGASEAEIVAAETRLGVLLPPSYRQFLAVSNGAYGNQLGLQAGPPALDQGPIALLPVADIGFVAVDDPLAVDAVVQYQAAAPFGQSTLHLPTGGDEVAYLYAPWAEPRTSIKRGHGHWSVRIGRTSEPETVLLLNPMVQDGAGEWELLVIQPEEEFRYRSFGAWLVAMLERERATQQPPGRSRARLARASAANPAAAGAAEHLLDLEPDANWVAARLERAVAPGVRSLFQEMALHLLEWLDLEHGTAFFAAVVNRILTDPLHDDVPLLGQVTDSPLPGLPDPARIAALQRSGDGRRPSRLSTPALAALYQAAPDPVLAGMLDQRACSPLATTARSRLDALVPSDPGYFRAATAAEVDHPPAPPASPLHLDEGRILGLGRRHQLPATAVARALVRADHADAAVAHLEAVAAETEEHLLLYTIAEIDTPMAWHALDRAADSRDGAVRIISLEAAARTHSPLLPPRAAAAIDGTDVEHLTALLALEIQPTSAAADALLEAWQRRNHLGALRALARRRDPRVLKDCLLLLADGDPAVRRVGAETVRDLRHPVAREALLAALADGDDDDLVVIVAHALVMMAAFDAVPLLRDRSRRSTSDDLSTLLDRWATQLLERVANN
jgi:hypothetical protein